jgi:hypothetical protein
LPLSRGRRSAIANIGAPQKFLDNTLHYADTLPLINEQRRHGKRTKRTTENSRFSPPE